MAVSVVMAGVQTEQATESGVLLAKARRFGKRLLKARCGIPVHDVILPARRLPKV